MHRKRYIYTYPCILVRIFNVGENVDELYDTSDRVDRNKGNNAVMNFEEGVV